MAGIELRSSAFNDHGPMPERMAHRGGNVSPPLSWSGIPEGTQELMLLCEDPDAGPRPFLHWLVTGINPGVTGVGEGEVPAGGRQWPNGFGESGYGGPQPPVGDNPHRYFFRVYALPRSPQLPPQPSVPDVRRAAQSQLASGVLVGAFAR
jgi:Raf kinase inhibitor-like YbhB/YbcL family protein